MWDLLQKKDDMPNADWSICDEMKEALKLWNLTKGLDQETTKLWSDELVLFSKELEIERDKWIENQMPIIHR